MPVSRVSDRKMMAKATPWFIVRSQSGGTQVSADRMASPPTTQANVAVGRRTRIPVMREPGSPSRRWCHTPTEWTAPPDVATVDADRKPAVAASEADDGGSQDDSGSSTWR